jgi:hypothetical protein
MVASELKDLKQSIEMFAIGYMRARTGLDDEGKYDPTSETTEHTLVIGRDLAVRFLSQSLADTEYARICDAIGGLDGDDDSFTLAGTKRPI